MSFLDKLFGRRKAKDKGQRVVQPPEPTKLSMEVDPAKALAFAEVLLERTKGSSIPIGTQLVFYEAMLMKGNEITLATDQSCYVEALLLYYIANSLIWGDSFRGTIAVATPEHLSSVTMHTIGGLSFRDILQGMKISVTEIGEASLSGIQEALSQNRGLLVVTDHDLKAVVNSLPMILRDDVRFVARLGHLKVSTFSSLSKAYA